MRRHPWLTVAIASTLLLLVFLVPAAMAKGGPGNKPCENSGGPNGVAGGNAPKNPNCYPVTTQGGVQYEFRPCKDGTAPPCAANKNFDEPLGAAIPTGIAVLGLGGLVLGYLARQRRLTLRLNN